MKKIKLLLIFVLISTTLFAQDKSKKDNIQKKQSDATDIYELFPTQNIWTFIKLDTRNGKMWQVHFSVNAEDFEGQLVLNSIPFVLEENEIKGRFTLFKTKSTRSLISDLFLLENIFRGKATFSATVIESNKALP